MIRVTADTNIWISSFNYRGNPRRLIEMARVGEIDLATSEAIIEETKRILATRFAWPTEDIVEAEGEMRGIARCITPRVTLDVVKDDPADNRIVECAVSSGSAFIVTGDNDLLRLGVYDAIRIVKVAEFMAVSGRKEKK